MTDRHTGYLVILDKDVRDDDAEWIINAMRMIKGVRKVEPIIGNPDIQIAESRARLEIRQRVFDALTDVV